MKLSKEDMLKVVLHQLNMMGYSNMLVGKPLEKAVESLSKAGFYLSNDNGELLEVLKQKKIISG